MAANLTQDELADRCSLFRTYMSRIETGLANPTFTVLLSLASGLGVPPSALFDLVVIKPVGRVRSARAVSRGRVQR